MSLQTARAAAAEALLVGVHEELGDLQRRLVELRSALRNVSDLGGVPTVRADVIALLRDILESMVLEPSASIAPEPRGEEEVADDAEQRSANTTLGMVCDVLRSFGGRAATVSEVHTALRELGWTTDKDNPQTIVSTALSTVLRKVDQVERVGRGTYRWNAAPSQPVEMIQTTPGLDHHSDLGEVVREVRFAGSPDPGPEPDRDFEDQQSVLDGHPEGSSGRVGTEVDSHRPTEAPVVG